MSRFRALLLGVAEYDDPGIQSLPCVVSDIGQVGAALAARGYTIAPAGAEGSGRVGIIRLRARVREYLASAQAGDTLVVYLSGHGVYRDGMTYLVPSDADLGDNDLAQIAVPLDAWHRAIDASPASGVLFLVDACREGFDESMSVARTSWGAEKIARAERRQVAWVFPCAEGQVARYVHADGEGVPEPFSLFARSVIHALADPVAPATLGGFADCIRSNMARLTREYGKPEQDVRTVSNGLNDIKPFVLFPAGAREPRSWEQAAAEHPAWQRLTETAETRALRASTLSLVLHLARLRHEAGDAIRCDPWGEGGGFALRMTERMSFLLGSVLRDLTLSPAEAALLVVAPFIYDAHWSVQLAKVARLVSQPGLHDSDDEQEASFKNYMRGFPRLRRKAQRSSGSAELDWWLLSQWLAGQAAAHGKGEFASLLQPGAWGGRPLAVAILSPARLHKVIRAIGADNGFFTVGGDLGGLLQDAVIQAGQPGEQRLRERLVSMLVVIAHRLAIEARTLSDVIPDHLGTTDPVDLTELRATLEESTWAPVGQARVLVAACAHPAVDKALQEHVAGLDQLLTRLHAQAAQPSLEALRNLPTRVLADQVGPVERDGVRAYDDAATRFRLAEGPVRELLLGGHGDGQAAAVGGAYRNAADACRYRKARTEYLKRTGHPVADWTGSIRLARVTDEAGRDCLDCADNGIGMGRRELTEAFAHVGMRFADLPEFREEKLMWDTLDPPVAFHPASRRGTGVLSYFALADEIVVDTCRLGPDGSPGEHLRATITGPDSLFRIQALGPGSAAGTTVRLYLSPGTARGPCLDGLRAVREVAEFATAAAEGGKSLTWKPGERIGVASQPGRTARPADDEGPEVRRAGGPLPTYGGRTVVVTMEWARHGKNPGDHEGYRVLAYSEGTLGVRNFREAIGTFDPGTPDELPQVAVSYVSLVEHPDRRYLALAIAEYVDGRKDATGRLIAYTRYLCAPYRELAAAGVGYLAMFRAFHEVDLPWHNGPPRKVSVPPVSPPVPPAGDLAVNVAAMLLTGRNVCVLGAGQVSVADRLAFIDTVMWLLPYGMRAKMSAATWTSSPSQHPFRLCFSDNPRPLLDRKQPDLVVVWERPDRTQQIPPQYPNAHEYLYWLRNSPRSLGVTLAGYTEDTGFSDASIEAMLAKIGVVTSATAPGPPAAPSAPAPPPDHAGRIMLAIDDRVRRQDLRGLKADVVALSRVAERMLEGSAAGLLPEGVRKPYQDLIVSHQLLRPELREQLGQEAAAFSRALLRLAFGLPLSYQGYCQLEDCLRAGSPPVASPPAALLHAIRRTRSTDERVTALVMAGLGEQAMAEWLTPELASLAGLAASVAGPWERPWHARIVCDMLVGYLRASSAPWLKPDPAKVVAALRPHGYLAPVLQARYPEDLSYQVEVLTSAAAAAAGGQTLREGDIVALLRGGESAPTWALFCAVLQLLGPDDRKLSALAHDAYFVGMVVKSGVGRDIRTRLGRHLSPDVEAIYQSLVDSKATQPTDHRMLDQAPGPAAVPAEPGPSFEPAPPPQPPQPGKREGKRFGSFPWERYLRADR